MSRVLYLVSNLILSVLICSCDREEDASAQSTDTKEQLLKEPSSAAADHADAVQEGASKKAATTSKVSGDQAEVGKPAPSFTLSDLEGQEVSLQTFRGQTVVLEWFNPDCPFVKASHTKGSLVDAAARARKAGVAWLAINSGAPGKQGHGVEANKAAKEDFGLTHPILLDESGEVGRVYGATNTPQLFVIDASGVLVYAGAVDNSPDGEGDSPKGGKLLSYVEQALSELEAGKAVSIAETKPYGCSVKY